MDVNTLLNRYKTRKGQNIQKPNLVGPGHKIDPMSNEALTAALIQMSGILDVLTSSFKESKDKFDNMYDIMTDIELSQMSIAKTLIDKKIVIEEDLNNSKSVLEEEYRNALEAQFDAKHFLFTVDRPVQNGDAVVVGLTAFDQRNGEKIDKLSIDKMFLQKIGSGELIPVIESQIIGMTPGIMKEFEITIPPEFKSASEFIGIPVKFNVFVFKVKEQRLPKPIESEDSSKN